MTLNMLLVKVCCCFVENLTETFHLGATGSCCSSIFRGTLLHVAPKSVNERSITAVQRIAVS